MSKVLDQQDSELAPASEPRPAPIRLSRRIDPSAVWTLFMMTVARHCRARRLLVLGFLFLLPIGIALLARHYDPNYQPENVETALIFYMIPHTLIPIAALLYASGIIQDEIEEQTLTYLLIRPLPRWLIYMTKMTATIVVTTLLVSLFAAATEVVVYWNSPGLQEVVPGRSLKLAALFLLSLSAYNALFGCLSLFIRRSLAMGVTYIVLFEGIFANIDFVFRRATVMYYFRVLSLRWLEGRDPGWSIDLDLAPRSFECVVTLAITSVILSALAAIAFTVREFRVKTPEAS